MALAHSKVSAQGRVSVPVEVRRKLSIGPGSILEWDEDGDQIVVRRSARFTSGDIHRALFPEGAPAPRTAEEMKEGVWQYVRAMRAVNTNLVAVLDTRFERIRTAGDGRYTL
jgi:AbrB family looped-hinge helix DNA binding protein